ncbi:alkaline phosphatase family protein [Alcanivorax sp. JB21]|nr:alkaline phosphatase family protein [Alcanivorax limicola]
MAAVTEPRKAMWGRIQWRPRDQSHWSAPRPFRLNANFDGSGIVVLTDLQPGCEYVYRAGWVSDPQAPDTALDWQQASEGSFRTAPADPQAPVSFLFGSCSYRFFDLGGRLSDDRADKTFAAMQANQAREGAADFVLFCGDQIYADPLNRLGAISSEESYLQRYRTAFGQPAMRSLMARTPTYMILDDHEIEDNWPASASARDWVEKFPAAIKAYQIYQASHSPAMPLGPEGLYLDQDPDHLWYHFSHGCMDMFVMDVRTERQLAGSPAQRWMISPEQEQALADWLLQSPERVKLIVSPVVLFPDNRPLFRGGDAWEGFVHQRTRILEIIRRHKLPRVAFVSGDVHASLVAALTCSGRRAPLAHSLVSSGLFWPAALLPFRWYAPMIQRQGRLATSSVWSRMLARIAGLSLSRYKVSLLSGVYSRDAFARVTVTPEGFEFCLYDRRGDPLPAMTVRRSWLAPE